MSATQQKPKPSDPCLSCTKQTKQAHTPEGNRFCNHCPTRRAYLKAVFDALNNYTFWEDSIMIPKAVGIANRQQLWTGAQYKCPACGNGMYTVSIESYVVPQEYVGIFKQPHEQRIRLICSNCGVESTPEQLIKEYKEQTRK